MADRLPPPAPAVFCATYASADRATDDAAGVRRLQRDGVITLVICAVLARDPETGALRRDPTQPATDAPDRGGVIDRFLASLDAGGSPAPAQGDRSVGAAAWVRKSDADELREQLAPAQAAVLVIGSASLEPAVSVALARANSLLVCLLTAEGERQAALLVAAAARAA